MLTKRQNMLETIRGGKPDRFVNQFEALEFIYGNPVSSGGRPPAPPATDDAPIKLRLGYNLIKLADPSQGGDLTDRLLALRRELGMELGVIIPAMQLKDDVSLGSNEFAISIDGTEVSRGTVGDGALEDGAAKDNAAAAIVDSLRTLMRLRADDFPKSAAPPMMAMREGRMVNQWGVTIQFSPDLPGPFPVHDEEHIVLKDITKWREQVKFPNLKYPREDWEAAAEPIKNIDRNEVFVTAMMAPGIFDHLHYLMGMENALLSFYEEPEALKELLAALTAWEMEYISYICEYFKPDVVFHHDDWGSHRSTFMSPDMFEEFILPAYKQIYGYFKANGVELIIHHSDSYAATLVPHMIEAGIDVFQGCVDTNDVPALIKQYGGKISFMGNINNGTVDVPDWTDALIAETVEKSCRECGKLYYIPCCTAGGPGSSYPGVFDAVTREINRMSEEMF